LTREPLELHVLHDRNPLFVKLSSGEIRNGYEIKILNKTHDHKTFKLEVDGIDSALVEVKAAGNITTDRLYVEADSVGNYHVLVRAKVGEDMPRPIQFKIIDNENGNVDDYESVFITRRTKL
jgi:polyferredoxin